MISQALNQIALHDLASPTWRGHAEMESNVEGETTSDLRSVQRERERERRRLRDRQRRQNMSQEQRERHLARRRRNYQLRRIRAENSKLGNTPQSPNLTPAPSHENSLNLAVYSTAESLPFPDQQIVVQSESSIEGEQGGTKQRLRMYQIRQLARLLHAPRAKDRTNPEKGNGELQSVLVSGEGEGGIKRLRLTHIKRLARAIKSSK